MAFIRGVVTVLIGACSAVAGCDLSGRVLDASGAAIPQAIITLVTPQRVALASQTSSSAGEFSWSGLGCGDYLVRVARPGFAERRLEVRLAPGAGQNLAVTLSLVPVDESVTVNAEEAPFYRTEVVQRVNSISRATLAERGHTVLTEVVNGEAGLHEQRTAPAMGSIFVRGLTGRGVSVYRDGFRYTTSAQRGGVSTFQNLTDPAMLDSVEVFRGPNSARFGSDSMGGSVNLVSAFPLDMQRRFSGEMAPSFDSATGMFGTSTLTGFALGRFTGSLALSARRVNTVRTAGGLDTHAAVTRFLGLPADVLGGDRRPDTAFTQYGGAFHSQYRLSSRDQLVFHYERGQQDGAKRYDQLLGGDGNLIADLRNLMLDFAYLRWQRIGAGPFDRFSAGSSYNAQREERVNQGGQGNPLGAITHQYERLVSWGGTFLAEKQLAKHQVSLGGEVYHERVNSPAYTFNPATGVIAVSRPRIPNQARYLSHGLFVEDVWRPIQRLRLSGALRFGGATYQSRVSSPTDSLTANAVTGRLGASFNVVGPLAVFAHYSRGFRAPNMTDLGTLGLQGNGSFEANVNDLRGLNATIGTRADDRAEATGRPVERLRPETSDNFDFGAELQHSRLRVEASYFRLNLGNTIVSQTLLLPPGAVGRPLGDQIITRQLASGAIYVPAATNPVLVRANFFGARMQGVEHMLRLRLTKSLTLNENLTWIRAEDERTGLPPDLEPGIPPLTVNPSLLYNARRFWVEGYGTIAGRQDRLSSLALADRRIGATRSRANIASFFNNGARVRGLVSGGRLLATGETVEQVQNRVLGAAASAPLVTAIPGFGVVGLRAGIPLGERSDLLADLSNLADKSYRGIGWGIAGTGRSLTIKWRIRF